jgi:hypothetical protein
MKCARDAALPHRLSCSTEGADSFSLLCPPSQIGFHSRGGVYFQTDDVVSCGRIAAGPPRTAGEHLDRFISSLNDPWAIAPIAFALGAATVLTWSTLRARRKST